MFSIGEQPPRTPTNRSPAQPQWQYTPKAVHGWSATIIDDMRHAREQAAQPPPLDDVLSARIISDPYPPPWLDAFVAPEGEAGPAAPEVPLDLDPESYSPRADAELNSFLRDLSSREAAETTPLAGQDTLPIEEDQAPAAEPPAREYSDQVRFQARQATTDVGARLRLMSRIMLLDQDAGIDIFRDMGLEIPQDTRGVPQEAITLSRNGYGHVAMLLDGEPNR